MNSDRMVDTDSHQTPLWYEFKRLDFDTPNGQKRARTLLESHLNSFGVAGQDTEWLGILHVLGLQIQRTSSHSARQTLRGLWFMLGVQDSSECLRSLKELCQTVCENTSPCNQVKWDRNSRFVLFECICEVLMASKQSAHSIHMDEFIGLLDVFSILIDSLFLSFSPRIYRMLVGKTSRAFASQLAFLKKWMDTLSFKNVCESHLCLLLIIAETSRIQNGLELWTECRSRSIPLYIKYVLCSKERMQMHMASLSTYVLKDITDQEFVRDFLPAAERALLRNPEHSLIAIEHLLTSVRCDLSPCFRTLTFLKALFGVLRSNEQTTRNHALAVLKACAYRISDETSGKTCMDELFEQFSTPKSMPSVEHRHTFMYALYICFHSPFCSRLEHVSGGAEHLSFFDLMVTRLLAYCRREPSESCISIAFCSLARLFELCTEEHVHQMIFGALLEYMKASIVELGKSSTSTTLSTFSNQKSLIHALFAWFNTLIHQNAPSIVAEPSKLSDPTLGIRSKELITISCKAWSIVLRPIMNLIEKTVVNASTAQTSYEGALAIWILLVFARFDLDAAKLVDTSSLWIHVLDPHKSILFQDKFYSKLSESESADFAQIFDDLLEAMYARNAMTDKVTIVLPSQIIESFLKAVTQCWLCFMVAPTSPRNLSHHVRSIVQRRLNHLLENDEWLDRVWNAHIQALECGLKSMPSASIKTDMPKLPRQENQTSLLVDELPVDLPTSKFNQVLFVFTRYSDQIPRSRTLYQFARTIIVGHHPAVIESYADCQWINLIHHAIRHNESGSKYTPNTSDEDAFSPWTLSNLIEFHGQMMCDMIFDQVMVMEPTLFVIAASRAMKTLAKIAGEMCLRRFIPVFLSHLDSISKIHVTEMDMAIWKTPEGILHMDIRKKHWEELAKSKSECGKTKDDDLWEQSIREEQARKRGQSMQTKEESLVRTQLDKEGEIRTRLTQIHMQFSISLDLLAILMSANPEATLPWLPDITRSTLLSPHLNTNLLVRELSCQFVMERLARFIDREHYTEWNGRSVALLSTVAFFRLRYEGSLSSKWLQEPLIETLHRSMKAIQAVMDLVRHQTRTEQEEEPLSPAIFFFFLYLLLDIIHKTDGLGSTELPELAVSLIAQQCFASVRLMWMPRSEMIEAFIYTQERLPRATRIAQHALHTICRSLGDQISTKELTTLLESLNRADPMIRRATLDALQELPFESCESSSVDWVETESFLSRRALFACRIWMACYDQDSDCATAALRLWRSITDAEHTDMQEQSFETLLERTSLMNLSLFLGHEVEEVQSRVAKAFAGIVNIRPKYVELLLPHMFQLYVQHANIPAPIYDEMGRIIGNEKVQDTWEARLGIALTLKEVMLSIKSPIDSCIRTLLISAMQDFFLGKALADRDERVRQAMLEAGLELLRQHGQALFGDLLPLFHNALGQTKGEVSVPTIPYGSKLPPRLVTMAQQDEREKRKQEDHVRESLIIFIGETARHLDVLDSRIPSIIDMLLGNIRTPSESVQQAIAECLSPLMRSIKDVQRIVDDLLGRLLGTVKYAERRGSAYALSGVIHGRGIMGLKEFNIMHILTEAIEDKSNSMRREGALLAFETFSVILGRVFEPYLIQILPLLLSCFSDPIAEVRESTTEISRVIMSNLSGHCIKLVLPSLLQGLDDDKPWRTKQGSIELLAAMAHCAPTQLTTCLPSIVPRLTGALTDSHLKVQSSAKDALQQISSVIRNPEVAKVSPKLVEALSNPSFQTQDAALTCLLVTEFVHAIDAPSLALVMPIVHRSIKERGTETKKKAAQVIGNMTSLTNAKDLIPYIPLVLPGIKQSLGDPVPEVRMASARALGALVKQIGQGSFDDLVPWLLHTLQSESSSVDRSGAAQGLSEVWGALGIESLQNFLPQIVAQSMNSQRATVREGFMSLFMYLPITFSDEFQSIVDQAITCVIHGLADESEPARDTAMKAGRVIVRNYGRTSIDVLLPKLNQGLFEDNWRIRQNSIQLLSDLLCALVGIPIKLSDISHEYDQPNISRVDISTIGSGHASSILEDDKRLETLGTEVGQRMISSVLGTDQWNQLLSSLYVLRSDVNALVRQAAVQVWKSVVINTPRTLKEILPNIIGILMRCLSSRLFDKQQIAARTLGDLVRKFGDRMLPDILPILEKGLDSSDAETRQGVCIGMTEVMSASSVFMRPPISPCTSDHPHSFPSYVSNLILPAIRRALIDDVKEVRESAARAFDELCKHVGDVVVDEMVNVLLVASFDDERAIQALGELTTVRAFPVLGSLLPRLLQVPSITPLSARILAVILPAASQSAFHRHFSVVLLTLTHAFRDLPELGISLPQPPEVTLVVRNIMHAIDSNDGVHRLFTDVILEILKSDKIHEKRAGLFYLPAFVEESRASLGLYLPSVIVCIAPLLQDTDIYTLEWLVLGLDSITRQLTKKGYGTSLPSSVSKESVAYSPSSVLAIHPDLIQYLVHLRKALQTAAERAECENQLSIRFFTIPKAVQAIMPAASHGLLTGPPDVREMSAILMEQIVQWTGIDGLKASVIPMTGALIRVTSERLPSHVKVSIVRVLRKLLRKTGPLLRPFVPQLQAVFIKLLQDTSSADVPKQALSALTRLLPLQTRIDPLVMELVGLLHQPISTLGQVNMTSAFVGNISSGATGTSSSNVPSIQSGYRIRVNLLRAMDRVLLHCIHLLSESSRQQVITTLLDILINPTGTDADEEACLHEAARCISAYGSSEIISESELHMIIVQKLFDGIDSITSKSHPHWLSIQGRMQCMLHLWRRAPKRLHGLAIYNLFLKSLGQIISSFRTTRIGIVQTCLRSNGEMLLNGLIAQVRGESSHGRQVYFDEIFDFQQRSLQLLVDHLDLPGQPVSGNTISMSMTVSTVVPLDVRLTAIQVLKHVLKRAPDLLLTRVEASRLGAQVHRPMDLDYFIPDSETFIDLRNNLLTGIMSAVQERALSLKLAAERVLIYALQLASDRDARLHIFTASMRDLDAIRALDGYFQRVLCKLADTVTMNSESEDELKREEQDFLEPGERN